MNHLGKADVITKNYLNKPDIFADVFNKFLYHGQQKILPENLQEMDATELVLSYGSNGAVVPNQKYRDVLKLLKTDGDVAYCLLGVENQTKVHYAMPVKNMVYDALQYAQQVSKVARLHRNEYASEEKEKQYAPSADEFLSGFYKTDRLLPVVTLVLLFSSDEWDAPMSLREMFSDTDESVMKYVTDYKIKRHHQYV